MTMTSQKFLKRIHVCGTLWFLLCAATLLAFSLYQAGFEWWLIFSISGYSAVLLFFVFTVYLFAIYQGVVRHQTAAEHPLSTSVYYIALYDLAPFLGTMAGLCSLSTNALFSSLISTIPEGTLVTTFLVWIVLDPMIGVAEALLPESAVHRKKRLADIREKKRLQKEENQNLLRKLELRESELQRQWNELFEPKAKEAALLLCSSNIPISDIHPQMIELGALAWQTGEIACMRYFHKMILNLLNDSFQKPSIDYINIWWDGIGTWRRPQKVQMLYLAA